MESEKQSSPVRFIHRLMLILTVSAGLTVFSIARADNPGGFIEHPDTATARPPLTQSQAQAFLPSRGKFTFPAPYNTQGVRLTNGDDCGGGGDCITSVGYSYWRNINNHTGSNTMYIFLGTNWNNGGNGPTLFSYDKTTDEVKNMGPLFPASDPLSLATGEGWYFSATMPTALYLNDGPRMVRYDVLSHQSQTIYDVSTRFGAAYDIWQMHSSDDDKVHSATLREKATGKYLGCVVYHEDSAQYQYFPQVGQMDECNLDRSGRWLISLEYIQGGKYGLDMRVIDLASGANQLTPNSDPISGSGLTASADLVAAGIERRVLDQDGAVGHADMGYGYVVGADDWHDPDGIKVWDFNQKTLTGKLVFKTNSWAASASDHISHLNAKPGVPSSQQYACGSTASATTAEWSNEVVCYRLDGSLNTLVVAPVMTDVNSPVGGDTYTKDPKGNLDVTGQYFIWTSNAAGRMDAYLVKVPSQKLGVTATGNTGNTGSTGSTANAPATSAAVTGGGGGGGGAMDPLALAAAGMAALLAARRRRSK